MEENSSVSARAFLSSIAKFSVSSWTGVIIGIAAVSITTRVFTPDIVGQLNMFNSAVDIFISFVLVGMGGVVNRFFYEPPKGWSLQEMFTRCLLIALIVLSISSLFIFSSLLNGIFFDMLHTDSLFVRVLFVMNTLSVMVLTYFLSQFYRYSNDVFNFTIQQILMQFFGKMFVVIAALIKPTLEVVLAFNTIGMFLLMVVYIYVQRRHFFAWKKDGWVGDDFKPLYRFAFFCWPNEIVQRVATFMLPYLITLYLGSSDLGVYSSAGFFVSAFFVLQGGFRTYWAAFMYRYYRTEQEKICKIHSYVGIAIIGLLGLCIIFQHIVYMLIGDAFHGSRLFFTLVLLPPLLGLWEQTTCYGISLVKKNEQIMYISLVSIALNVFGIYICIQLWGLIGASIGVGVASLTRFLLMSWRGQIYYKSIRSKIETLAGLIILLVLAVSNVILNQNYLAEFIIVMSLWLVTYIIYRQSISEVLSFIRL